jgi:hypothetical protein
VFGEHPRPVFFHCPARKTAYTESAGLNRHVVGVQVPAGKEIANPS